MNHKDMFICKDCGEVFHLTEFGVLVSSYFDEEDSLCCPCCHSDDYEEAVYCNNCGKFVPESDAVDGYCKKCIESFTTAEKVVDFCQTDDTLSIEINWAVASILQSLGISPNEVLKSYLLEVANNSAFKVKAKEAAFDCITKELDTRGYMEVVTA